MVNPVPPDHRPAELDPQDDLARRVLDNLIEGCQVVDPGYRYLYVNDAVLAHGRQPREALLGRTMMEVYPGIDQAPFFPLLRRCMEERKPQWMLNEFTFPDGSRGWFELRMEPVPAGVVILSVDITERKRAEEALRRSQRALTVLSECNQALVRASDERVFMDDLCRLMVDKGGYRLARIRIADEAEPTHLRLAASAAAPGLDGSRILVDDGSIADLIARARRTGVAASERLVEDPDDTWRADVEGMGIAASIALPVQDEGRPLGVLSLHASEPDAFDEAERGLLDELALDLGYGLGVLRARREREELRGQLEQSQRLEAVGRLAGGVAHDFNNLLTVILASAQFALDQPGIPPEVEADVQAILEAGQRASSLTRQLLAFSRKQILRPEVLDLNQVVRGIAGMLGRLLGEDVVMDVRLADGLGRVRADPGQIEQVLVNLAVNARDAMPRGGTLRIETAEVVSTARAEARVQLSVGDTGCGMAPEVLAKAFEPFFTTKERGKGTGLGLSTVYGIVKQSEGDVQVESTPGQGSTFTISLPRVERAGDHPQPDGSRALARGSETILVVEDEVAVRDLTIRMLAQAGYHVLEAASGDEAVALHDACGGAIDLLLSDVVMPGMDGPQLASRLANLPVLFISGYTDEAIVHRGLPGAAAHYLAKPFTAVELTQRVREVLDCSKKAP